MKNIFTFVISLFLLSINLSSQSWCVTAQSGRYFPSLTNHKGDFPNCGFITYHADCPDIGFEFMNTSGIVFSTTIGYQKDWYNFSDRSGVETYGSPLHFAKTSKSIPIIFSSGYTRQIGKSHFRINALAGIGFGIIRSNDVSYQFAFDGYIQTTDAQGNIYLDNQHVIINIVDSPIKKVMSQGRISISLEYVLKSFFVRSFFEARSWLSHSEEITYHSERSSSYYQLSQTLDGHFSVRTGYLGVGIGVGWYFKNPKS